MEVDIVVALVGAWFAAAGVFTLALGKAAGRAEPFRVEGAHRAPLDLAV